jgi:type I restriction enzyme S subunit
VTRFAAGGTPSVSEPQFWSEDAGTPWVAIGDMTTQPLVQRTERRVTLEGIASKRLPIGRKGTVLFAMYASVGTVSVLDTEASWNQAILGMEPIPSLADQRFLVYWLLSLRPRLQEFFRSNTQDNLNAEQVGNLPYPVLPVAQQRAIADFLDAETARIDALIEKKRRLVHLLELRFESWIRSILWSLDAPTLPLKRKWQVIDCKHRTPEYITEGYPVMSPGDATAGRADLSRCTRFVSEVDFLDLTEGGRRPKRGDIIYSRNASIGIACYLDTDEPIAMGQDVCLIKSANQDQLFLSYCLNSIGVEQLEEQKMGSTFSRINVAQIVELRLPCPSPGEQARLAAKFDSVRARTDTLQSRLGKQIELLIEHRQALITAAVTGQLEVLGTERRV